MAKPSGLNPSPPDDRLTESKLAQLESAWRGGEFRSVLELLEKYPSHLVAALPMASWLLACCHFDAGDLASARACLDRTIAHAWRPALGAALLARLEAADGRTQAAMRALEQALAAALPSADAAALRIVLALSLQQFDRLEPLIGAAAALPPARSRMRRLVDNVRIIAANLRCLEGHRPELARRIVAARPWDYFHVLDMQGTPTPILRTGRGQEALFPPDQHSREAEALRECEPRLRMTTPVLLIGLGTGMVVGELAKVPPLHGKRLGIVAIPTRFEELCSLLLVHDWSELIADRVIYFLDADSAALESYLRADLRRVPLGYRFTPCVIASQPVGTSILNDAHRTLDTIRDELNARVQATGEHYGSAEFADRWRSPSESGGLRLMIQSCRYTTFVHHNSRHLAQAFRAAGHAVKLLEEGDEPQQWIGPAYLQAQIAAHLPDLYIRINFLRQETDATIPAGLPFLTWVQDYCPTHFEAGRAERLLPRDYLTGISKYALLGQGFPACRYLPNLAPSLSALYRALAVGGRSYREDVGYVSHQSTPPAEWIERFGQRRRSPEEQRWVLALAAELDRAYREGRIVHDVFEQLGAAFVNSLVPQPWPPWAYHHALQLTNLYFRQTVLAWIAEAGYRLALFGLGWERHPSFARFARGPVANGPDLRECYRAARIHLQLMATGNLHQRLIDGYLAGAFFLMPRQTDARQLLPVGNRALHARLMHALTEGPIATVGELRAAHPDLAEYLVGLVSQGGDGALAFAAAENDVLSRTDLRIPRIAEAMFRDRDDLLQKLDYWLRRDDEREAFVARVVESGCLESFTAEFQVGRILRWLSRRISHLDPPIPLPPLLRDAEQGLSAEGPFIAGRAGGTWTLRTPGGALVAEGAYRDGVCDGAWKFYAADGTLRAAGQFSDNKKFGRWEFFDASGRLERSETYRHDVLDGPCQKWYSGGALQAEGAYQAGLQSGFWTLYNRAGRRFATGEFSGGKKCGRWTQWHPNGQPARTAAFVDGKRQGDAVAFHPNGVVWARGQFENDNRHGAYQRYYADGAIRAERSYLHGQPHGQWTFYYRNGQPKWTLRFQAGRLHGAWATWYADGRRRSSGAWSGGARCGEWLRWDRNGTVIQQMDFGPGGTARS